MDFDIDLSKFSKQGQEKTRGGYKDGNLKIIYRDVRILCKNKLNSFRSVYRQ